MGNHKFLRKKIVSMTKVDIFSGFLGAGKTTLIKKLIAEAYAGEQLVLIENEFGEIGIDGGFLQDAGVNITEMNSGCICCSLVGDFGNALQKVLDQYHPDRILIEPSGVGKLSDVIRAVQNLHNAEIHLESFTTVVDAKKCKMYQKNFGEFFNNQIEHASCLILSHTAGLAESKLEDCVQRLRALNTTAPIVTTDWEQLSGEQLLAAMNQTETLDSALKNLLEETEHEHDHEHEHHHHHDHDDHDHDESCGCHDHDHHHDHDEHDQHHHDHDHDHGESCTCGCHDHDHDHEHHHHDHDEECGCGHDHDHEHHHHDHDDECGCGHHHDHHHHHADEVFTSWGRETIKKFTREGLEKMLESLSASEEYGVILRAKGMLPAEDGTWIYFDMVPEETEIREGSPEYTGRLCVIGSKLNEEKLVKLFGVA